MLMVLGAGRRGLLFPPPPSGWCAHPRHLPRLPSPRTWTRRRCGNCTAKPTAKNGSIRIVKERTGIYRYPEPKLLAGTNYCDIGFERDPHSNRLVVLSAIDNLMKGAAGQALQSFN